jgi:phage shock protein C
MPVSNFWGNIMDISTSRLMRSRHDAMIAGVAGGIAGYLGVDSTIVRLVFCCAALYRCGGAALPGALDHYAARSAAEPGAVAISARCLRAVGRIAPIQSPAPAAGSESEIPIKNLNERGSDAIVAIRAA